MFSPFLPALLAALIENRKKAGVSQEAIAIIEGVSISTISRFEKGEWAWPHDPDKRVASYAQACGTTPGAIWREALGRYDAAS